MSSSRQSMTILFQHQRAAQTGQRRCYDNVKTDPFSCWTTEHSTTVQKSCLHRHARSKSFTSPLLKGFIANNKKYIHFTLVLRLIEYDFMCYINSKFRTVSLFPFWYISHSHTLQYMYTYKVIYTDHFFQQGLLIFLIHFIKCGKRIVFSTIGHI